MKISTSFLLLLLPFLVNAQNQPQFDQQEMQAMMQNVQEMQICMQSIDQNQLKALEQQGQRLQGEIESLCSAGKLDQAQEKAISFAKDVTSNSAMIAMKNCTKNMQSMIPGLSQMMQMQADEYANRHVCDS